MHEKEDIKIIIFWKRLKSRFFNLANRYLRKQCSFIPPYRRFQAKGTSNEKKIKLFSEEPG